MSSYTPGWRRALTLPVEHVDLIVKDKTATPGKQFAGRSYWWQVRQILEEAPAGSVVITLHPHPWPIVGGRVLVGVVSA